MFAFPLSGTRWQEGREGRHPGDERVHGAIQGETCGAIVHIKYGVELNLKLNIAAAKSC